MRKRSDRTSVEMNAIAFPLPSNFSDVSKVDDSQSSLDSHAPTRVPSIPAVEKPNIIGALVSPAMTTPIPIADAVF
jgi:hypothetical protein